MPLEPWTAHDRGCHRPSPANGMRLECAARLGSAAQHGLRVVPPPGGWLDTIHHALLMAVRELQGREASPTLGIIDSQTVKVMAPAGPRGYDNAKKINGRKRHILVDSLAGGQSGPSPGRAGHRWGGPGSRRR